MKCPRQKDTFIFRHFCSPNESMIFLYGLGPYRCYYAYISLSMFSDFRYEILELQTKTLNIKMIIEVVSKN